MQNHLRDKLKKKFIFNRSKTDLKLEIVNSKVIIMLLV